MKKNNFSEANSLERFISAQNSCYEQVISELSLGKKVSHWIWYIFPQIAGLGFSEYSIYFGIRNLDEAKTYWGNQLLRERYLQCLQLILDSNKSPVDVLGEIDARKLQSSITLFLEVDGNSEILNNALENLYFGSRDVQTLKVLKDQTSN
jgi:hypothetical protein